MSTIKVDTIKNGAGTREYFPCTAWVNFNGTSTVAIRDSGNVSSITDNGTGDYTVSFATVMDNVNYSFSFGGRSSQANGEVYHASQYDEEPLVGALRVRSFTNSSVTARDITAYCVTIYGGIS